MATDPYRSPGTPIELPEPPSRVSDVFLLGLVAGVIVQCGGYFAVRLGLDGLRTLPIPQLAYDSASMVLIAVGFFGPAPVLALWLGRRRRAARGAWVAFALAVAWFAYQLAVRMYPALR